MKKFKTLFLLIFTLSFPAYADGASPEETNLKYLNILGVRPEGSQNINEVYKNIFNTFKTKDNILEGRYKGDDVTIYRFTEAGLWGDIKGIIAFNHSQKKVLGLEILEHQERKGAPIDSKEFKDQFVDLKLNGGFIVVQEESAKHVNTTAIDGISGATATNNAIETGLNKAFNYFTAD